MQLHPRRAVARLLRRRRFACPRCGGVVEGRRSKCPTCGYDLEPTLSAQARTRRVPY